MKEIRVVFIYNYFDAHCDTMSKMYKDRLGLDSPELMVNTGNLRGYESAIQVFALFNEGDLNEEKVISVLDFFKCQCKKLKNVVSVCTSKHQIDENKRLLSAILAIEGLGNQPDFNIKAVKRLYDAGVRFMSLCWNNDNSLCGGCEGSGTGLTDLGRQTLAEMEKYKIILDVSHMSDKSFWEGLENYSLPLCATHSVSRKVHNHRRNLTDEQFVAIAKRGGVCGINFYPPFLCEEKAEISTIIRHIEHFMALGGENSIGLGSDFDGISETPYDIKNSADFYKLFDALLALNYSEEIVEKIAYKNFKNLFAKFTA